MIADKEPHVKSEDFGKDLTSVQTLFTKQVSQDFPCVQHIANIWPTVMSCVMFVFAGKL